ncbi:hypothetical protein ACG0Z4_27900 [Enterocloster aldenensis]|uniref:hypothetical protein n=1 Tax=Enterocloster aldenensis TaxID=358742 RepID=UPI0040293E07
MKKTKLLLATLTISMALSSTALAGTWLQDNTGWYYQNDDGSFPTNQWFQDFDGRWYYLNESGYMLTNGTSPDGRAVGADGAWIQPVTGDVSTVLREINNWVIGDIWNHGYCDFYHYEYDGKDSTGQSIDIDYALQLFKDSYKKKAGYDAYINSLSDDYAALKTAWNKLSGESDKLYRHFEFGVQQTGTDTDTAIFVQYRDAFSKCVSEKR